METLDNNNAITLEVISVEKVNTSTDYVYEIPQRWMTWTHKDEYIGTSNLSNCLGVVLHSATKEIGCAAHIEFTAPEENYIFSIQHAITIMFDQLKEEFSGDPRLEVVIIGSHSGTNRIKKGESASNFRHRVIEAIEEVLPYHIKFGDLNSDEYGIIGGFAYNPKAKYIYIWGIVNRYGQHAAYKRRVNIHPGGSSSKSRKCIIL